MADFPTIRRPDYPVEVQAPEPEVLVSRHRDGSEQRRLRGAGDGRIFRFTIGQSTPLTRQEAQAFLDHYAQQYGQLFAFNWTHPEWNEILVVRYAGPIQVRHVGYNAYELELQLKEVPA
jgi:phage-related protein